MTTLILVAELEPTAGPGIHHISRCDSLDEALAVKAERVSVGDDAQILVATVVA